MILNHRKITFYYVLLIVLLQVPLYVLFHLDSQGLLLAGFLLLLIIISLLQGAVAGLYSSLVYLFIVGSVIFYIQLTKPITFQLRFSMLEFFIYGLFILILVLIAGKIKEMLRHEEQKYEKMNDQISKYVAVDSASGFDNRPRLETAIVEEVKRVDRSKSKFVFLLIEIQNYKDFKSLYGENEATNLIFHVAENITKSMRITDKKFRFDESHFAMILPDTSNDYIQIIYEKLAENLKEHTLLSGNLITLSFKAGHYIYLPNTEVTFHEMVETSQSESRINEI